MYILAKTLAGESHKVDLPTEFTSEDIFRAISNKTGIDEDDLVVIKSGLRLAVLVNASLVEGETVYVMADLEGGKKKKKKRVIRKDIKGKHKKRAEPLATLKIFSTKGDKVVRMRQQCKNCPAGTFLSEHADRLYCGKCHFTEMRQLTAEEKVKIEKERVEKAAARKAEKAKKDAEAKAAAAAAKKGAKGKKK